MAFEGLYAEDLLRTTAGYVRIGVFPPKYGNHISYGPGPIVPAVKFSLHRDYSGSKLRIRSSCGHSGTTFLCFDRPLGFSTI